MTRNPNLQKNCCFIRHGNRRCEAFHRRSDRRRRRRRASRPSGRRGRDSGNRNSPRKEEREQGSAVSLSWLHPYHAPFGDGEFIADNQIIRPGRAHRTMLMIFPHSRCLLRIYKSTLRRRWTIRPCRHRRISLSGLHSNLFRLQCTPAQRMSRNNARQ